MKSAFWMASGLSALLGLTACSTTTESMKPVNNTVQAQSDWYQAGQASVLNGTQHRMTNEVGAAKNVILFVGDGMGVSTVTAARILAGQLQGKLGEEHQLSFERFPYVGLSKTYNTNQQTADSAGTMSAMVTGVKTKAGVISVAEGAKRANCASSKGQELTSILALAERQGKATGIVTTARLTHATPAATYAHSPERNWESDDKLTAEAKEMGCQDIATQFIEFDEGDGIEVAMGGGRRHFLPRSEVDIEGKKGRRKDGQNLMQAWQNKYPDGQLVQNQAEFDALDANSQRVLGLFNSSHMRYEADRHNDVGGEPSLSQMTGKALDILAKQKQGYFLMVESGRIDHGHHAGSAFNALTDTVEMAKAVQTALDKVNLDETLIIVTADHSHVFTIAGYPTRGNPILGKVVGNDASGDPKTEPELAMDDLPYTTLGYTNGRGFADYGDQTNADKRYNDPVETGRQDLTEVDTQSPGFHQEALIPRSMETHGAEDVAIYAIGPGAHLVSGVHEQNVIFHIMNRMGNMSGH